VLIVGGASNNYPDDVEIWDPQEQASKPLGPARSLHRGHAARLLDDGRVQITDTAVNRDGTAEIFDPASGSFVPSIVTAGEPRAFRVAGTTPDGRATVPVTARLAMWFSTEADVRSITSSTIALEGPAGDEPGILVPVEKGRLVFFTPTGALQHATQYRLRVEGAISQTGQSIARFVLPFRTEEAPRDTSTQAVVDDEIWTPGSSSGPNSWRTGRGTSPWQSLKPLQAPAGVTALAGQALRLDGRPLSEVTLRIGDRSAQTDRTGRFLLTLPATTVAGRQVLEMDGTTAGSPGRPYGFFEVQVQIVPGGTTILPFTIWMPRIDLAHRVRIPSHAKRGRRYDAVDSWAGIAPTSGNRDSWPSG
jgi:hypothetical protein